MAKAKYTRGKDGFFRTKIWDGTYNVDGSKHRVILSLQEVQRRLGEESQ